jgi:hypothetical protein
VSAHRAAIRPVYRPVRGRHGHLQQRLRPAGGTREPRAMRARRPCDPSPCRIASRLIPASAPSQWIRRGRPARSIDPCDCRNLLHGPYNCSPINRARSTQRHE